MSCGVLPNPGRSSAALRCCGGRCRRRCASTAVVISARRCPSATSVFVVSRSIRATRFTGVVNRRVSNTIIARYNGAIGGVGFGGKLRPGDHPTLTGLVSTASCDVTLGYALPPGRYTVQFLFGGYNTAANGGTKIEQFVSTPIPLTVTNEPPPPLPVQAPLSPITIVPGSGGGGPGSMLPAIHPGARAVAVRWVHHLTSGKPTDPCTRTDLANSAIRWLTASSARTAGSSASRSKPRSTSARAMRRACGRCAIALVTRSSVASYSTTAIESNASRSASSRFRSRRSGRHGVGC